MRRDGCLGYVTSIIHRPCAIWWWRRRDVARGQRDAHETSICVVRPHRCTGSCSVVPCPPSPLICLGRTARGLLLLGYALRYFFSRVLSHYRCPSPPQYTSHPEAFPGKASKWRISRTYRREAAKHLPWREPPEADPARRISASVHPYTSREFDVLHYKMRLSERNLPRLLPMVRP